MGQHPTEHTGRPPLSSEVRAPFQSGWKSVHLWWSLASASLSGGSQKTDTAHHTEGRKWPCCTHSPVVDRDLQAQFIHEELHYIIAFPMKLQSSPVILWGPLKIRKADESNFPPFAGPLQAGSALSRNRDLYKTSRTYKHGTFPWLL